MSRYKAMKRTRSSQLVHSQQPVEWRRAAESEGDLSDSDDEWWSDDSSCSTCSSEDEGWKFASEAMSGGELFYIECKTQNWNIAQKMKKKTLQGSASSVSKPNKGWKKGAHGTLAQMMNRNRKSKNSQNSTEVEEKSAHSTQSTNSPNSSPGEIIEVRLLVEPRRPNLGRRATLCEMMLGIVPGRLKPGSEDDRILVAGFIPDMPASMSKKMKLGDWLQCIDGQQVFHSNIDSVLLRICPNATVTLRLRRIEDGTNIHAAPYLLSKGLEIDHLLQILCKGSAAAAKGSLLLLEKSDKIIYNYPQGGDLVANRGIFITLCHFLEDTFIVKPQSTRILFEDRPFTVLYLSDDNHVLLLALPADKICESLAVEVFRKFVDAIHFTYHSFVRCAEDYKLRLDLLVDSLLKQVCNEEQQLLFHTHSATLPIKIQIEVDSALSLVEAAPTITKFSSDLFLVIGSCLYYKNVCVRNHLPDDLLSPLTCLLWIHNILSLEHSGLPLQRLLAWKEVFPPDQQVPHDAYDETPGRYFILLLGQNQLILAVLIKCDFLNESNSDVMKPSVAFIEQVQETLDNLQLVGLANVLDSYLDDKGGESAEKVSVSDQQSNSSDHNFSHRSGSVEGIKRYSPKRNSSRLSINSEGETISETSSEASWNSSEVFSYGRLNRYKSPSRLLMEPFERNLNAVLVLNGRESVILANNASKDSLDRQIDLIRISLMSTMSERKSRNGVMEAIIECGFVLASRGRKSDEVCLVACKRLSMDGSAKLKLVFVWSDDIAINFNELSNRLSFLSV
ncbi:protein inturned isoform X2 [Cloeon dipterum]|uniref:protein inturned isoform X2 n=1 Tax=Cloeon dipterum TaxID=197152 RepID=UPI0032201820